MEVVDVGTPDAPGPGEVLLAPEAVGLCGSDFHYFLGDIGTIDDPSSLYPRIQGHEVAAMIVELGAGLPRRTSQPGMRVAMWPVNACGHCYPCSLGRGNACARISLTGIHADGALQERLLIAAAQVFPVGDQDPALAALIEPVSVAVRAVARGRVAPGEHVVILGAGPIGQALALAATDRGASVLLVDRLESRLAHGVADRRRPPARGGRRRSRRRRPRLGGRGRAGGRFRGDGCPRARADGGRAGGAGRSGGRRRIGVLPGIGPVATIAMLLPLTFKLPRRRR